MASTSTVFPLSLKPTHTLLQHNKLHSPESKPTLYCTSSVWIACTVHTSLCRFGQRFCYQQKLRSLSCMCSFGQQFKHLLQLGVVVLLRHESR